MEMILVNESGCKIQATIRKTMIYRATRHQFKLIFQFRTTVRDAICDFISKFALTISLFTELLETKEDFDFLVDVVGLLVSVSEEKEYDKDGKKMKMAVMELAENDHRIWCALFGEYVDELNRFLSSGSIPHGVSASQPISIVGSGKNIEIEEDFMKLTPRCTVKSLDDNNRARTFIVLAKIAEIVEDGPWWYSACVCGRSVQAESGIYFCQFCNIHVTNVTPRFRVKVLVEDSTGVVFGTQSPPIFQENVGKTMLFKVLSRPVGMEKFKGTYPVRRVCDDAAIVGICSKLFAGSPQCTQKKSSVVDLGADEDAKCPLLKRKSADAVVDKLNEVDSSKNSCDEVDESEEKDVKPSLKRLRRSLRLQFDEADESRGSGNDGSSGHGVN
ncbi:Replication factor-A carboxy-terminal domain protein [Arachis hypogaea]|nr:Replication factor-A carboxy-terminal domain protein [Arachis hypogaea]